MDQLHAGWQKNHNHTHRRNSGRVCDQGLSTWGHSIASNVDDLIGGLNENECYTLGYADDITILICGKFPNTVSELLQEALTTVQQWCYRNQLSINPQKMVIVPFTRKSFKGSKQTNPLWTHLAAE
jgi:Reverse transcriptase (RNA-dependent DNA polymerase).